MPRVVVRRTGSSGVAALVVSAVDGVVDARGSSLLPKRVPEKRKCLEKMFGENVWRKCLKMF